MLRRRKPKPWVALLNRGDGMAILEEHEEEAVISGLGKDAEAQHWWVALALEVISVVVAALFAYLFVLGRAFPLLVLTSIGRSTRDDGDAGSSDLDPTRPVEQAVHAYLAVSASGVLTFAYVFLSSAGRWTSRGRSMRLGLALAAGGLPLASAVATFACGDGFPLIVLLGTAISGAALFAVSSHRDMLRMLHDLDGMRTHTRLA
jgi:hypothetical protein|tara:strand:- start:249 stop:860 length:612 start_codon:yes stop_codon:yes gene_type:complete